MEQEREDGVGCFEKVIKIKHLANHINRERKKVTPKYLLDPLWLDSNFHQMVLRSLFYRRKEVTHSRLQPCYHRPCVSAFYFIY